MRWIGTLGSSRAVRLRSDSSRRATRAGRALADEDDAGAPDAAEHEVLRARVDGDRLVREVPAAADGAQRRAGGARLALDLGVRGRLGAAGEHEHGGQQRRSRRPSSRV